MYKIKLPNFDGPFDLLLYFIKRDELNIYDIPIAKITEEFLNYVRLIQLFDLELAGEFIVMAATLMYIKLQMLLPKDEIEEQTEIEDPRKQLVQKLIEYKMFKEASANLSLMAETQRFTYYRKLFDVDFDTAVKANGIQYKNTTLFDLVKALKKALDKNESSDVNHVVELIPVTVEEKIEELSYLLKNKKRLKFFDLTKGESKRIIVVTFLSLLEMIKAGKIFIVQSENFDDIIITLKTPLNLN